MLGFNDVKKLTFFLVGGVLVFGGNIAFAGFGVSPPSIKENKLVPGSHFEKTVYLVQGDPQIPVKMEVVVDSKNMTDWVSLDPGKDFIIPAGVQQFPLNIIIDVPEDIELGVYKAFVRMTTKPEKVEGEGNVSIALGGRVDVELIVGDNIVYEYNISSIKILNVKESENPKISVLVENTGNVPVAPSTASFELFNKFGNIRLAYAEADTFTEVDSFSIGESHLEFPIDIRLAMGEYWGHVKIYNDKGQVIKELKTVFNVHEGGFSITALTKFTDFEFSYPIIFGGIFLLLVVFKFRKIFSRKK